MKHDSEPTILDVLIAINEFSNYVEAQMITKDEFYRELDTVKSDLSSIKNTMVTKMELNSELDQIRGRLTQTVTKDYLDDKLSDLRGEFFLRTNELKKRKV